MSSRFHEHLDHADPTKTDIVAQIREATSAPSPLSGYLKDAAVADAIDGKSRKERQSSSSTRSRQGSLLGVVLAEEEKQAHRLKSLLRSTGDRLDREIRRGSQALCRAEHAEAMVHELTGRVSKAESSKYAAEMEAARAKEEIRRYQIQIERLERDVKRLQADVTLLENERNEADESAARARDTARKFQMELRNTEARQMGREEGMRYGMHKWFNTGRNEGWDVGHTDGYEEGRDHGFAEGQEAGRKKGWEQGRREERERALQAFDDLFAAEIDPLDKVANADHDKTRKQAQRWSNWMRRM